MTDSPYTGLPPPSSKLPFALGDLEAHLIHDFLGPPESTSQTTCRSVQQFLQAHYCDRQTNTDHATPSITFRVHNTSYSPFIETMHLSWTIFGRLFLKRFALCYWTLCLSCPASVWRWCIVAKWSDGSRCHLLRRSASAQARLLDGDPAPPCLPKRGTAPPQFSAHVYCSQMVAHFSCCWALVEI